MALTLTSKLFRYDSRLQAAAVSDPHHILLGAVGQHVEIQSALILIDRAVVDPTELRYWLYGRSTANAVLAYKRKRRIINYRYQTQADDIVGKMTIASLDREMLAKESLARPTCNCGPKALHLLLAFSVDDFIAPPAPGPFLPPPPLHLHMAIGRAPDAIN